MEDSRNIIKAIDALSLKAGGEVVDSKNITDALDNLRKALVLEALSIDPTLTYEGLAADAKAVDDKLDTVLPKTTSGIADLNEIVVGSQGYAQFTSEISPNGVENYYAYMCTGNANRKIILAAHTSQRLLYMNFLHYSESNPNWSGWNEIQLNSDSSYDRYTTKRYTTTFGDSTDCENFIFYTDPHLASYDYVNSISKWMHVLEKTYRSNPVDFVICGGDWITAEDTKEIARNKLGFIDGITTKIFMGNHYMIVGNHDFNYSRNDGQEITSGNLINLWFRKQGKMYYSFDGNHTRFYILDTGIIDHLAKFNGKYPDDMDSYRWEQIDWLANSLIEDDKQHSALALHIYKANNIITVMSHRLAELISAYNSHTTVTLNNITYDFTNCTGRIEFMLAGHNHADNNEIIGGIPVIITKKFYDDGTDISADMVRADYTRRKLYMIRIGDGSDRTISLDTGELITS